jgi:hypothetical protein
MKITFLVIGQKEIPVPGRFSWIRNGLKSYSELLSHCFCQKWSDIINPIHKIIYSKIIPFFVEKDKETNCCFRKHFSFFVAELSFVI